MTTSVQPKFGFSIWKLLYTAGILVLLAVILLILSGAGGFTVQQVLIWIARTSYKAHQNIIFYTAINNYPLTSYLYLGICATAIIISILCMIFRRLFPDAFEEPSPLDNMRYVTFVVLCMMNLTQLFSITNYWRASEHMFNQGPEYERTSFARPKRIADSYQKAAEGYRYRAHFITDIDISQDPGMLLHRSFAFFLYPIDIRNIYQKDVDAWIVYETENATDHVPEGYAILHKFDERNVMATKQQ